MKSSIWKKNGTEWNELVRERIQRWVEKCLEKPKLRTYVRLKKKLRMEPYLSVHHRSGLPELTKLRGGTNRLRIEQGRYRKEAVEERVCEVCDSKQTEDEKHFMLECKVYDDLREKMWREVEDITQTARSTYVSDEERLNALIGDRYQPEEKDDKKDSPVLLRYQAMMKVVMKFVTEAMNRRRGLVK